MLATLINKWIMYDGSANLEGILSEIKRINDYSIVLQEYMKLYNKYKHAQKRYLLLKLLDHLLYRFKGEIGAQVSEFLMEIVQGNQGKLVPKDWSIKLKEFTFQSLEKWYKDFPQFRAFKIAYQQILDLNGGDRSRIYFPKEEIPKKLMQVYESSFQAISTNFYKEKEELDEIQQKLETSIELLLETQNLFDKKILVKESKSGNSSLGLPMKNDIYRYGLGSSSYNLNLSIDVKALVLSEIEDNSVLFLEIREGCKLIEKKYLPNLIKWTRKIAKIQMNANHQEFLKKLIDSKNCLDQILLNVRNLGISWDAPRAVIPLETVESEEDEEFMMVSNENQERDADTEVIQDFENYQSSQKVSDSLKDSSFDDERVNSEKSDAATLQNDLRMSNEKARLFEKAPVVEYGEDLEYWDKVEVPFSTSGLEFQHRFLGEGPSDRMLSKETVQKLKMRTVALPPLDQPSTSRPCNAPIKNGKLCQRRDLEKCPIHGVIVERDLEGVPLEGINVSVSDTIPEWQKLEDMVNRAHPMEKRQSQIEAIKKTSKERIDTKLSKSERKRSSSEDFEANLKLRDRKAFKW